MAHAAPSGSPKETSAPSQSYPSMHPRSFDALARSRICAHTAMTKATGCPERRATTANLGSVVDPSNHRNHSITSSPIRRSWTGTARKPPPLQTSSVPLKTGFRLRPGRRAHGTTPYRYAPGEARRPARHALPPYGLSRPTGRSRGRRAGSCSKRSPVHECARPSTRASGNSRRNVVSPHTRSAWGGTQYRQTFADHGTAHTSSVKSNSRSRLWKNSHGVGQSSLTLEKRARFSM